MKKILLIAAIFLGGMVQAQNSKLEVHLSGFDNDLGEVRVGLYNSEGTFLKTTYKSLKSEIANKTATVVFTDLPPGDYAISAYQDENKNAVLDKNAFGIPSEDYAASNNAKGMMGPPKYADAKFSVKANSKINIIFNK